MDQSLLALCDALKKVMVQLKPHQQPISFLLLTGKTHQGKTALLRQSHYHQITVDADKSAHIFYDEYSIILELSEVWLNQNKHLLEFTLKQLNRCHSAVKVSGLILCVDINELFTDEPQIRAENSKSHAQFLERFGLGLGYQIDTIILFTKLDLVAGFCDFFQNEHPSDLNNPLGFSLKKTQLTEKPTDSYQIQFDHFIESLGQKIIDKIHPVRSSIKRTLIREFPLQIAYLKTGIQSLIQQLSPHFFNLDAIYFTSAEQGGISLDRLNKKIQHEYGLSVQDQFPQSTNYQAYFIDGALTAFSEKTKRCIPNSLSPTQKWLAILFAGLVGLGMLGIGKQYFSSTQILDDASKELLSYDILSGLRNKQTSALYHLTNVSQQLNTLAPIIQQLPNIQQLSKQLSTDAKQNLNTQFLPKLVADLEKTITDNQQSLVSRYNALKIYIMIAEPKYLSQTQVLAWFNEHWNQMTRENKQKRLALLTQLLNQPIHESIVNQGIIRDVRNYLNALPVSYLYYSLAKQSFPKGEMPLKIDGFNLSSQSVPTYLTKTGFQQVIHAIPNIASQLQADNWVMQRQDLVELQTLLQQAYCYEYVVWWQNFMRHSLPTHAQDYQQARLLTQTLSKSNAMSQFLLLLQHDLSPESESTSFSQSSLFNQEIASKFTELSLISQTAMNNLSMTLSELERFLSTLSIVNDQGKTAFMLTKARFQGDTLNNPLSSLYNYAQQLPDPVSSWVKQVADDTWFTLINDSKRYINQQWKQTVLNDYMNTIAHRYPFDSNAKEDIAIKDFNQFFANNGILNQFIENYLKPFIDVSQPQWALKESNHYVLPISSNTLNELIRANIVTNMFFPNQNQHSKIDFSLQKLSLDPMVGRLRLSIGDHALADTQTTNSFTQFHWPQANASLVLNSIEGEHFTLEESGPWAFFKILQKVNVLIDEQDPASLQILFEINGNSGRYLLKTENEVNPFTPGILNGFTLPEAIV